MRNVGAEGAAAPSSDPSVGLGAVTAQLLVGTLADAVLVAALGAPGAGAAVRQLEGEMKATRTSVR
jgi:hypothetical protein